MVEVGDERLCSNRHGGSGRRVFGLEWTRSRQETSGRVAVEVDVGDERVGRRGKPTAPLWSWW